MLPAVSNAGVTQAETNRLGDVGDLVDRILGSGLVKRRGAAVLDDESLEVPRLIEREILLDDRRCDCVTSRR